MKRVLRIMIFAVLAFTIMFCNACYADDIEPGEPYSEFKLMSKESDNDIISTIVGSGVLVVVVVGASIVILMKSKNSDGANPVPTETSEEAEEKPEIKEEKNEEN